MNGNAGMRLRVLPLRRSFGYATALVVPLTLLLQYGGIDIWVADHFYDFTKGRWRFADSWLANTVVHDWGRNMIAVIFLLSLVLLVTSLWRRGLRRWRRELGYLAVTMLLTTALAGIGKHLTNVDCARDLERYGGSRPYVELLADKPGHLPRGACFPGGHSSGAFALFALVFLAALHWPRYTPHVVTLVLMLGLSYAVTQWGRGAHFPSHDLWSAYLAWLVAHGLAVVMLLRRRPRHYDQQEKSVS